MTTIAIAVHQTAPDCRWSLPATPHSAAPPWTPTQWICVRDETLRPVSQVRCEHCPYWAVRDDRTD
jgi:hypothetical protein